MDAGGQDIAVAYLQIEVVQFLQQTAAHVVGKVSQMVMVDPVHCTAGLLHQQGANIGFICRPILLLQHRRDSSVVFLPQLPQIGRFCTPHCAGIRYVKNVFQMWPATAVLMDECDALGPGLDPPTHGPIPQLHAGTGGGVRALGVNQKLVVKIIFE